MPFGSPQSDATVDAPSNHATTNKLTAKQVDAEQVDAGLLRPVGGASIASSGARLLGDPDTDFVIAYAGERASGYCPLRYRLSLWCDGIEAHVDDLFVEADAPRLSQRAGFASERSRWDGGRQLWLELEPQQLDTKIT